MMGGLLPETCWASYKYGIIKFWYIVASCTRPKTFQLWKTRGYQCSFRLLMMGGVLPETCWASYKYGIIKFWYIVASCTRPTTFQLRKTRGCQCSFRFLMMGGVLPEACWASYKYGIVKFWYIVASCWIFLYEFYYDARIHEHQIQFTFIPRHTVFAVYNGLLCVIFVWRFLRSSVFCGITLVSRIAFRLLLKW